MNELVRLLGSHPPFDALTESALTAAAEAAELIDCAAGELILDAFTTPSDALYVVLSGQVEVWNSADAGVGEPDEVLSAVASVVRDGDENREPVAAGERR